MQVPIIPPNEQERLATLLQYRILDTLPEQDYDDYVQLAAKICHTPIALMSLVDQDRQWFKAKVGLDAMETPRDISFCGHVVASGSILVVPDATKDERFADNPLVLSDPKIRFYAGVPIISPDGYVLGTLCVIDYQAQTLTDSQLQQLEILSRLITKQLELRHNIQSAQRLAEDMLRAGEQRYETLAAIAPVGIFRTDAQGNCVYVNERWCQMAGLTPEAAMGRGWYQGLHPEDWEHISREWEQSTQNNRPFQLEYRFRDANGNVTWVYAQSAAEYDNSGNILGFVGTVTDITDRKQAEHNLKEAEERLQTAQQIAHLGSWDLDLQTNTLYWSAEVFRMFERDPQQFGASYETLLEAIHPDDREMVNEAYSQHLRDRTPYHIIHRLLMPDNRVKYIQARCETTYAEDGTPLVSKGSIQDITDLHQVQLALKRLNAELENRVNMRTAELEQRDTELQWLNQRLQLAARSAQLGIWDWDVPNDVLTWDERMYEIYGVVRSDALPAYMVWQQSVHPDDRLNSDAAIQAALRGEQDFDTTFRIVRPNGHTCWIEAHAIVQRNAEGQAVRMIGTNADVSDRKQVELDLQHTLQELSAFQSAIDQSAIVTTTDSRGRIISVNDRFCQISGYSSTEIIGQTHRIINSGYHPPEFFQHLWRTISSGKLWRGEICNRSKNNRIYWVDSVIIPFLDDQGKLYQYLAIRFDITNRKIAETALQSSQQKFQRLVEDIGDKFVIFSHVMQTGIVTYVSAGITSVFGIEKHDIINKAWADAINWLPEDAALSQRKVNEMQRKQLDSQQFDLRFIHPDGELRTIHVCQHSSKDSYGNILAIEGIVEDITERKRYETQLRQTNNELARATRLKDEFLAAMSHELRTPLNAVLGMTEALQEESYGPVTEPQKEALQTVFQSGSHLLDLINDILDLAKVEAGHVELEYTPTNLRELCQSSLMFVQNQACAKRIQTLIHIDPGLPTLVLDQRRICQVLINLLTNAVKFTPEQGKVTLQVTLAQKSNEEARAGLAPPNTSYDGSMPDGLAGSPVWVKFTVIDTGIGICQTDIPKLFQPFVQIDSALNRKYSGTGLGLSLVKRIVELHGGTVGLSSQEGEGSCFWFVLPCTVMRSSAQQGSGSTTVRDNALALTQPSMGHCRILLAEDNLANIKTMASYLKTKGYDVVLAHNGKEAIAQAKNQRPDLILMDIQMPEMDGIEAIEHIRGHADLMHIPIIALTALAMDRDRDQCLAAGATNYLSKPIKLRQLVTTIQQTLRH